MAVANFALIQTTARALPVDDFGLYSLILVGNGFVLLVFYWPITDGINRFLSEAIRYGNVAELQFAVGRAALGAAGLVCGVCALAGSAALALGALPSKVTPPLCIASLAYFLLISLNAVATNYLNASRQFGWYFLTAAGAPMLGSAATLLVARSASLTAMDAVLAQCAAQITVLALFLAGRFNKTTVFLRLLLTPPSPSSRTYFSTFLQYASSIPWLGLGLVAFMFTDRVIVARFLGLEDVGRYTYMYTLTVNVVVALYNVYSATTYLRAVEQISHAHEPDGRSRALRQFVCVSLAFPVLFVPLLALYALEGPTVMRVVFGHAASAPPGCLSLLLVAAAVGWGAQQLSMIGNLLRRQSAFIVPRWLFVAIFALAAWIYHPSLRAICLELLLANGMLLATVIWLCRLQLRDFSNEASLSRGAELPHR